MNRTEMAEYYDRLYEDAVAKISSDEYQIDELIDAPSDQRFGITLLLRPPEDVKHNIQRFLADLRAVEPEQYYYSNSDIHVTVASIISCYAGFDLDNIHLPDYISLIEKCLEGKRKIGIYFNGITASPSCIMIRGITRDNTLNDIRGDFRNTFRNSGLEQSIDKRYTLQTAHSTVVRFRKPLERKEEYLDILEKYREHNFGSFEASEIELVYNDWYQRSKHVKQLYEFNI